MQNPSCTATRGIVAYNHAGERVRGFMVTVHRARRAAIVYPALPGDAALRTMRVLAARGHEVTAHTSDGSIHERLTVCEMEKLYSGGQGEGQAKEG